MTKNNKVSKKTTSTLKSQSSHAKVAGKGKSVKSRKTEQPNNLIEDQTAKIPNLVFMGLAGASIAASIVMATKQKEKTDFSNFVGQWAPTFLLLGLYNKMVKVERELE